MARIMVVEDDVYMREELTDLLRKSGYETASLFDFENAIPEITEYSPDLVLLDINLPFHSGFEICKELKAKQLGTVLVLTARDKLQDELHALGLGADDYLTKPCNIERLLARIKNLLRRKEEQIRQGLLDGNGFLLDPNTFTIYVGKSSSLMPPNEGKILLALLKKSPNLVTKHELCNVLWGTEECIDENALQVTFTRLRKTLREFGLGILMSNVHMAWTRAVCGRLKSDYSYSNMIVYNNFPWPSPTNDQKEKIRKTAQAILNARALYTDSNLADLYDPLTMPTELLKAHKANNRAVMHAYGFSIKMSEADCVAELMRMYQKLTKEK